MTVRLPSRWVPAIEDASLLTPSWRSPSERDRVDVVVEQRLPGRGVRVEQAALAAGGHRHADRVGQTLPERAGGHLDAGGVAELGVAGGLGVPGPQRLEVVELEAEASEVELGVEGDRAVAGAQHEPVARHPVRVGRVVPHHLLEQQVRRRRQAHRGARMAVPDLLHGVHRQHARGVDRLAVQIGPLQLRDHAHEPTERARRPDRDRMAEPGSITDRLRAALTPRREDLRDDRRP